MEIEEENKYSHDLLPARALSVVKASKVLTPGEKLVWCEQHPLDGLEGAYISNASLAARLGMTEDSVKQLRWRLGRYGLLRTIARTGARQVGYRLRLPVQCVPDPRASFNEIGLLARELDAELRVNSGSLK
jgi:hypothetical protein